ncbi:MAG: hypothetical protein OEZ10_05630 [Gammaproteobacteria bacterium]|nr:hypothetical protein [Gammaproteobacteria bacterium]
MSSVKLAKLTAPAPKLVSERKRLFAQLDASRDKPVVWLSAAGGSGKTTLISTYLRAKRFSPLWYKIDEGDADIASFFKYMTLLATANLTRGEVDLPQFRPEYLEGLNAFARNFFRQFFEQISARGVLVLDNFQEAGADSSIIGLLPVMVEELPPGRQIVVVSRHDPPESLSRLMLAGEVELVNRDALRLTDDECAEIIRLRCTRQTATQEQVRAVNQASNGWMAGLILRIENCNAGGLLENIDSYPSRKAVFEYFNGEIFDRLEPAEQELLLAVAYLPAITVESARHLSSNPAAGQLLSGLAERNYFTVESSDYSPVFELHPLFQQFLRDRLEQDVGQASVLRLIARSAEVLQRQGMVEAAIELMIKAGQWHAAVLMIGEQAEEMLSEGRGLTVVRWLESIPEDIRTESADLNYWLGLAKTPYDPASARELLSRSYEQYRPTANVRRKIEIWRSVIYCYLRERKDYSPLDDWIQDAVAYMEPGFTFPDQQSSDNFACAILVALAYRQPGHPDMERWLDRAEEVVIHGEDDHMRFMVGSNILLYHAWYGAELARAEAVFNALESRINSGKVLPQHYLHWYALAPTYLWMLAQVEHTSDMVAKGFDYADRTGIHFRDGQLLTQHVYAAISRKDFVEIDRGLARLQERLQPGHHWSYYEYYHLKTWGAVLRGDVNNAAKLVTIADENLYASGNRFFYMPHQMLRAYVYYRQGNTDKAYELADAVYSEASEINAGAIIYKALLMKYRIHNVRSENEIGKGLLAEMLRIASRANIRNHIEWDNAEMASIYAEALSLDVETDYAVSMIRQRGLSVPEDRPVPGNWPFAIRLHALGTFSLEIDDKPVTVSGSGQKKPMQILKAFIGFGRKAIAVESLVSTLWPDAEGDAGMKVFHTTLHRLRKLLGYDDALVLANGQLTMDPRFWWIDADVLEREIETLARLLRTAPQDNDGAGIMSSTRIIAELYKGDLLAHDADAFWALPLQTRLRKRALSAMQQGIARLGELGLWDAVEQVCEYALEIDPVAEVFHRELMTAHIARGQQAEAIRQYQQCRAMLSRILKTTPGPETVSLYKTIAPE